ncbi:MAG TPA: Sua5/YciO/YrdC/YwlC family protein, partial [Pirellulales bacterium]
MPPGVIDLQFSEDRRDVVHRAVQALAEGFIVVFPTDVGYFAAVSALSAAAAERLAKSVGDCCDVVLGVKHGDEAADYLPPGYGHARRLMRRGWPGSLFIDFPVDEEETALGRLPGVVREMLVKQGRARVWLPCHKVIQDVLQLLVGPVVLV